MGFWGEEGSFFFWGRGVSECGLMRECVSIVRRCDPRRIRRPGSTDDGRMYQLDNDRVQPSLQHAEQECRRADDWHECVGGSGGDGVACVGVVAAVVDILSSSQI